MMHVIFFVYSYPVSLITSSDIIVCQIVTRCMLAAKKIMLLKRIRQAAAVTLIQSKLRAFLQKQRFVRTKSAVAQLQASIRMLKVVESYNRQKRSSTIIATHLRMYECRKRFQQIIKGDVMSRPYHGICTHVC